MTDFSYTVGFLMFAALEEKLGAPALTAALRDLFQEHKAKYRRADARPRHASPLTK